MILKPPFSEKQRAEIRHYISTHHHATSLYVIHTYVYNIPALFHCIQLRQAILPGEVRFNYTEYTLISFLSRLDINTQLRLLSCGTQCWSFLKCYLMILSIT